MQAGEPSPSSITVSDSLRPHVTFKVQSSGNWRDGDLVDNEISRLEVTESEPEYIKKLNEKLSRTRLITDIEFEAVGAHGFCVPLSNESPS